ncbi:MAG TPA: HAMP domain-containing histidine kinase [Nitrospirae bacterium]|nr:sporulation kinase A [bacterium BMS3Bbin05]HDO22788.1 HAMP domain-containing histidine kinase [Nitrospirota bacterium]HDO35535.1 HAMP domain-containing histidine kinase [Nitrospirota bacterium]HDZ87234.1 HAMP domain-containing histidine kinase [Nitrospirota bacterium]
MKITLSLQQKFIILTFIAVIVLMTIIGYMVTVREKDIMYKAIERQGRILAETLAIPIINDLIYEKLGLVEEGGLIDNYTTGIFKRKELDLLYLAVLDDNGKVISHNDFREYGKVYKDPLTLRALNSRSTVVQKFHDKKNGYDAVDFATPLSIGKKRWGTLKFAVSLKKIQEEIRAVVMRVVMLTVVVLFVGFFIILLLSRQFIRPITTIARIMEKAGGDSLDVKVDVRGHDELALLGRSFNRMIERIKEANIELRQTHEKLLQSEKLASVGILASGVAHEINNPLGGLFNCVDMLNRKGEDASFRQKYLDLLKDGLSRIETTVGKLLWMSRKGEGNEQEVSVKKIMKDVYDFVEYHLRKKGIFYEEDIEEKLHVHIDPHDFQQIIMNLIINAIQSMENGGTLSIRAFGRNGLIIFEVRDTGEGIAGDEIDNIFDPFFTTKAPGEGTGLGLWLTYEIVKNYNGNISVRSKKGGGSTFSIIFRGNDINEKKDSDY